MHGRWSVGKCLPTPSAHFHLLASSAIFPCSIFSVLRLEIKSRISPLSVLLSFGLSSLVLRHQTVYLVRRIMKFVVFAAAAASLLSSGLVSAAPRAKHNPLGLDVSGLGGATFKIHQKYNKRFRRLHRGPRAIAKAYQKHGIAFPDDLLAVLQEILAEQGVIIAGITGGLGDGNGTTKPGQGS